MVLAERIYQMHTIGIEQVLSSTKLCPGSVGKADILGGKQVCNLQFVHKLARSDAMH